MNNPTPSEVTRVQARPCVGRFPQGHLLRFMHEEASSNPPQSRRRTLRGTVVFQIEASTADQVKLAADFTDWERRPIDLRRSDDGIWQLAVDLPRGQYSYRFLVDGEWRDDPRCQDYEPNPFGGFNGVVRVA